MDDLDLDLDLVQPRRKKMELLDPRLVLETRNEEPQKQQGQGKIPGIIWKGVVVALAMALLPLVQKQSNMTNHATVARSWELINLVVIGLVVSYGLMARRPDKAKDENDNGQGTYNYVQKMFEFARVFDDVKADGVRDKVESWSSRWQPEEPLVVFAGKKDMGEKPLLLPVRSLKSTLSDPDAFDFVKDGATIADSKPLQESKNEVRNGELFTVESGNFDEEMDHLMSGNDEPAVFPSPIPWASRRDVLNGGKESHQPAENLEGKIEPVDKLPAIPGPIPWHSRPDRISNDGKQKNTWENPNICEGKPPLAPPQRPPLPPSPSPSPSPSPRPSPSPPRPRSAGLANGASYKNPLTTPPQNLSSPRPSPSPPRPRSGHVENGSSQTQTPPKAATTMQHNLVQINALKTPSPPAVTENGLRAKNGSSQNNNANGDVVLNSASSDEVKPRKAPIPSPPVPPSTTPLSPARSAGFEECPLPRKVSENGIGYRSDSRSKSREGSSSHRSESRSKSRDDASSHSQHSSRQVEMDSSVVKQKMKDTDIPPRMQSEKSSRKFPSPPPPPVYDNVPFPDPLPPPPPPPPPPPLYPDEPTSDPTTPPHSVSKDEEHTPSFSDDLKHEVKTTSSSKVVFEVGTSDSEPESELRLETSGDESEDGPDEVDKKADQFIAKFHEQIRLQKQQSIRRSQERH